MSRENVEVVRRAFEEFFAAGQLPFDLTDPDIRIENVAESPLPGPYHGHRGMRQWWSDIADALPGLQLHLEEVIDVGDDRVVGVLRFRAEGAGGQVLEQLPPWAAVHWLRDGRVFRTRGYLTKTEALQAVGLRK